MKWLFLIILGVNLNAQTLVIRPNESAQEILNTLHDSGAIRSVFLAKVYLKLSGQTSKLRPGTYNLPAKQSFPQIVDILTRGPEDVKVMIPEGWRREQIAQYLSNYLSDKDFLLNSASLEGKLFPDTYFIQPPMTSVQMIKLMTDNFDKNVKTNINRDTLIMASMIEREARVAEERGIISGILWKRYKNGWPLQVDATIQYARGNWSPITDTKFPSAYNTYTHLGLPPGPIGNPGLGSIKAALEPVNSPYWYYLHDNNGGIHYAKTLEEHNLNVDKYLNR